MHEQDGKQAVELVYDVDCPNVEGARNLLRNAMATVGLPVQWTEWNRAARETPISRRAFGSPTILVDGRDVASSENSNDSLPVANSCRLYRNESGGLHGVPSLNLVVGALARAHHR